MPSDPQDTDAEDIGIGKLARKYLRTVNDHEAAKEALLSDWAEEYYLPGYLDVGEWELVKCLMDRGDTEHAQMQIEVAIFRKVATEQGRAQEFDDEWPAKGDT